jgi:UPF0755 protein
MKKIFVLLLFFLLWAGFFLSIKYKNFENQTITTENLEVKKWDTMINIQNKLCDEKVIDDCLSFKFFLKINPQNDIKIWNYSFSWESLTWFLYQLAKWPKQSYEKFTILPWRTKYDIFSFTQNQLSEEIRTKFLKLITDKEFILTMKEKFTFLSEFWDITSLEWFIYPDTYFFKKSDIDSILFPELLIKTSIWNFEKKRIELQKECENNSNCNTYKLSNYEILIIASIIQKEERTPENKPQVADILIKRYENNRMLWTDWTLCYGLEVDSSQCKNYLFNKYLKDSNNKYNTRANVWLTPSCVWNPTIDTIKATFFSSKNNYWYYLHDNNGQIHYWKNQSEHNTNKTKYLWN